MKRIWSTLIRGTGWDGIVDLQIRPIRQATEGWAEDWDRGDDKVVVNNRLRLLAFGGKDSLTS
eukprot:scaffold82566_cov20-Prasinocladus_malaysianus.AAC.1